MLMSRIANLPDPEIDEPVSHENAEPAKHRIRYDWLRLDVAASGKAAAGGKWTSS
jgi:hypothetical protein